MGFEPVIKILDRLFIIAALLAVFSIIIEYGFYITPAQQSFIHRVDIYIIWFFVLQALIKLALANKWLEYLKAHWFTYLLVVLVISETAFFVRMTGLDLLGRFLSGGELQTVTKFYIIGFQISLVLSFFVHGVQMNQKIAAYQLHPAQVLMGSFLLIIILGTGLLMLPKAVQQGPPLLFVDALFTSTSATCVTGLIVVDTGTRFSLMGQIVILALIQIGGLGFMTYASFFALILRRRISLREKSMLREMLNFENLGVISKLLSTSVLFTFGMEALGAVLLYFGLGQAEPVFAERAYSAVFHAISAFCNAGFSIYSDSFMQFTGNYLVLGTISLLIIFGGLGFPVILNLIGRPLFTSGYKGRWLSVQTKIVLLVSGSLLLMGFVFFLFAENHQTLSGMSLPQKFLNAFFQSVTTRTAGFNSVNIGLLSAPVMFFFLLLMFIGASPGSTGGGIKTTTFGVLVAGVWSVIRERNRVEIFKRNIPFTVLNRAMVIVTFSILFIFTAILILTFSENLPFTDIIFETFSAFGTVGLSMGITPLLGTVGKLVIIMAMYFGRLGALTISLAITTPKEIYHYDYPTENVMVG